MNPTGSQDLIKQLAVAFGVAILVGIAGALLTDIGPWYRNLAKPSWQPPDWLFGPAWTTIFGLSAVAAVLAWRHADTDAGRTTVIILFVVNIFFNVLWSTLFFTLKRPDWALIEVVFLWSSVLALVIGLYPYSERASALILPYLFWVSFASVLNWKIVQLNPLAAGAQRALDLSGAISFILLIMVAEVVVFAILATRGAGWERFFALLPNIIAGMMILAAWKLSLMGANVIWILALLGTAGLAHATDLFRQWRGADPK